MKDARTTTSTIENTSVATSSSMMVNPLDGFCLSCLITLTLAAINFVVDASLVVRPAADPLPTNDYLE